MKRLSRVRSGERIRNLTAGTIFRRDQLIQPIFVTEGLSDKIEMATLPGVSKDTEKSILLQLEQDVKNGTSQFILFLVPEKKSDSDIPEKFYSSVIGRVKKEFPNIFLWVDTCLCSLTTHGHCGLFNKTGSIDLDKSVNMLSKIALAYARAGADGIAPSDMMDGRVKSHRTILDSHGFGEIPILSYSTKFKSNFYGPFREAADSAPAFGDRATYQIDVRNIDDALSASIRDMEEGADLLMVKPGITSIDLIGKIRDLTGLPTGAYQVSGEYASLYFLSKEGYCDFNAALLETWNVFARAGASFLITYAARRGGVIL